MDENFLSDEEKRFLTQHGIPTKDVLDVRSVRRREWEPQAKTRGVYIVLGSPCGRAGHRLRTRAGHCAQCDPKKIAFQKRHSATGFVYVAFSVAQKLVKIGSTSSINTRGRTLRNQEYAGANDWRIRRWARVKNMGKVENDAHSLLKGSSSPRAYQKDGRPQQAAEVYRCHPLEAIKALRTAVVSNGEEWD
jgi:hypothetical protein